RRSGAHEDPPAARPDLLVQVARGIREVGRGDVGHGARERGTPGTVGQMSVHKLFDLTGKVALVTGGSRGLGLQMAEALGELGAKLAISARKQKELDAASASLSAMG